MSIFRIAVLLAPLLALLVACGNGGPPVDLTSVRDSLPHPAGAYAVATGAPPPGANVDDLDPYKADQLYFLPGTELTREEVIDFFRRELPKLGWELEEPPGAASGEFFQAYCNAPWISCADFVKGDARVIIAALTPFGFNPVAPAGNTYHVHLEER